MDWSLNAHPERCKRAALESDSVGWASMHQRLVRAAARRVVMPLLCHMAMAVSFQRLPRGKTERHEGRSETNVKSSIDAARWIPCHLLHDMRRTGTIIWAFTVAFSFWSCVVQDGRDGELHSHIQSSSIRGWSMAMASGLSLKSFILLDCSRL